MGSIPAVGSTASSISTTWATDMGPTTTAPAAELGTANTPFVSTTVSATTGMGPASAAAAASAIFPTAGTGMGPAGSATIPTATAVGACAIPAAATTPATVVACAKWHERLGWTTAIAKSDSQRYMY